MVPISMTLSDLIFQDHIIQRQITRNCTR